MILRCYGARGSVPVSGAEYLKYGGDTACLEIRTKDDDIIIVDAGTGIRRLGKRLLSEERFAYTILMTHSHWDHVIGFPFFQPIYRSETAIQLRGCPQAQGHIQKLLSRTMAAPYFPVPFDELRAEFHYQDTCVLSFWIGSVEVFPINLSHPNGGLGYKFSEDGRSVVFLTDNELDFKHRGGLSFDSYVEFARGADLLIHDAEYTPEEYDLTRGWGHSTYPRALELAIKAGVKSFALYHHNQDRSDAAQDAIVERCREILAEKKIDMECFGMTQFTEVVI